MATKIGIQKKTWLASFMILLSVLLSVFVMAGCGGGGGTVNPPKYVQVVYDNVNVEFGTFYDALAWLNGHEASVATAGYNRGGYLKNKTPTRVGEDGKPQGSFQIIILGQQAFEGWSDALAHDANTVNAAIKEMLAIDNPNAYLTLSTSGGFNVNFRVGDMHLGFAKTILDKMTMTGPALTIYGDGNDITLGNTYNNLMAVTLCGGRYDQDVDATRTDGKHTGKSTLTVNGGSGSLVVWGGNFAGGTFKGDSEIIVNGGSPGVVGGGSNAGTHDGKVHVLVNGGSPYSILGAGGATAQQKGDVTLDIDGGTMKGVAGTGSIATGTMEGNVTVNFNGGTTGYLIGGSTSAAFPMPGDVTVFVKGGTIQNQLSATTLESNNSAYKGAVTLRVDIGEGMSFTPPMQIIGNYNHNVAGDLSMRIDSSKTTNVPNFSNTTVYVADKAGANFNSVLGSAILDVNAPKSVFSAIYISQNPNAAARDNLSTSITGVQRIREGIYGAAVATSETNSVLNATSAYITIKDTSLTVSKMIMGFKNLTLDNARVTMEVGGQVLPAGVATENYYTAAQSGNLTMKNGSSLSVPRPASPITTPNSAVFYTITGTGTGEQQNLLYGWTGVSVNQCGIACYDKLRGDAIGLGLTANAPTNYWDTTSDASKQSTFKNLRAVIWHGTAADNRGDVKPESANPRFETVWPENAAWNAQAKQFTYITLYNAEQIRLNSYSDAANTTLAASDLQDHKYGDLEMALGAIKAENKPALHYKVTFLADYEVTAADAAIMKSMTTDAGASLTYTSSATDPASTYAAPPADANYVSLASAGNKLTFSLPTTLRNVKLAAINTVEANGQKALIDRGVGYYADSMGGAAVYIDIFGGTRAAFKGHTDLTICSGTYRAAAGASQYPSRAEGNDYNLTIHGGDYSGGLTETAYPVSIQSDLLGGTANAQGYYASTISACQTSTLTDYTGSISGGFLSEATGSTSGGGNVKLTIDTPQDNGLSFVAPSTVSGLAFYDNLSLPAWKGTIDINIDSDRRFGLYGIYGLSETGWRYGTGTQVNMNVNLPDATVYQIIGYDEWTGGTDAREGLESKQINLDNVKYVHVLRIGAVTGHAQQVANSAVKMNLRVTGTVNAGTVASFSDCTVDGADAELNVLGATNSASIGGVEAVYSGTLTATGAYLLSQNTNTAGVGNLTIANGATVNLYNKDHTYQNVYMLKSVGYGNHLNVASNKTTTTSFANTAAGVAGLLNVYGSCSIPDGSSLTLGLTPNSVVTSDQKRINILAVVGKNDLQASYGTTGGYWDSYMLTTKGYSTEFDADLTSGSVLAGSSKTVRTDGYKNYTLTFGDYETFSNNVQANAKMGNVYLETSLLQMESGIIRVKPSPDTPDEADSQTFYDSLAAAADAIRTAKSGKTDYKITFLTTSGYTMTSTDSVAVQKLEQDVHAKSLAFDGKYDMERPGSEKPKQGNCLVDMNGVELRFNVKDVTFADLILEGTRQGGFSGTEKTQPNIVLADTVQAGVFSNYYGDATTIALHSGKTGEGVETNVHLGKMTGVDGVTYAVVDGIIYRTLKTGESLDDINDSVKWFALENETDGLAAANYYNTEEKYVQSDGTSLKISNLNNIGSFEDKLATRDLVVTGTMKSPAGVLKLQSGKQLYLHPTSISITDGTIGTDAYQLDKLVDPAGKTGDDIVICIPKGLTADGTATTLPLQIGTIDYQKVQLGILNKGAVARPMDKLLTGGIVADFSAQKYVEYQQALRGIKLTNEGGESIHLESVATIRAVDFTIEKADVLTNEGTLNTDKLIELARVYVIDDVGDAQTEGITVSADTLKAEHGQYPVVFSATVDGRPQTVTVTATVVDHKTTEPNPEKLVVQAPDSILRAALSTPFVGTYPATGLPVGGVTWKIVGGKDADGTPVDPSRFVMATADPEGTGIYLDPTMGKMMVGRNVSESIVRTVTVEGTPPAASGLQAGTLDITIPTKTPNDSGSAQPAADIELTTNDFEISMRDFMKDGSPMGQDDMKKLLVEKTEAMAYPTSGGRPTSSVYPVSISDLDSDGNAAIGFDTLYNDMKNGVAQEGDTYTLWYQATDKNGYTIRTLSTATVVRREDAGIHASDFSVNASAVYADAQAKTFDDAYLAGLAGAYAVDAAGRIDDSIAITVSPAGEKLGATTSETTLTNQTGIWKVTFKAPKAGSTTEYYTTTVQATVTDNQQLQKDPTALLITAPRGGVKAGTQSGAFIAANPASEQAIANDQLVWSVTGEDGAPMEGVSIDETGKLTTPATLEDGTVLQVVATPKEGTDAAAKFLPGTLTFPVAADGTVAPKKQADVGIRANSFAVGVNQLATQELEALVKSMSQVYAWNQTTLDDLTENVQVFSLGGLTRNAKRGQSFDIILRITDEQAETEPKYAEITVKATIYDNVVRKDDVSVWANNFTYGDELFVSGELAPNAADMVLMLAQAGARNITTGEHLKPTATGVAALSGLDSAHEVTFSATSGDVTASVKRTGVYKSGSIVDPTQPVNPQEPNPNYGGDIQLNANDLTFGDELFEEDGATLVPNAEEMVKMLAQAAARKLSDGSAIAVSVKAPLTLGREEATTYPVTFTATNAETKTTKEITVDASYKGHTVVKPTQPVNPTPDQPDPSYGEDIQLTAKDFTITLSELNTLTAANRDSILVPKAQAAAKRVSNGMPITPVTVSKIENGDNPNEKKVVFTATNPDTKYTASVTVSMTCSDEANAGVQAQNFTIAQDEIYVDGALHTNRILALSRAYAMNAFGEILADTPVTIKSTTFPEAPVVGETYSVELATTIGGTEYTKTVQASVRQGQKFNRDPSALTVTAPSRVQAGATSEPFTAQDRMTNVPVTDVVWSVGDPSGKEIEGVSIDPETGKLTLADAVEADTTIQVTATPKEGTDAAEKYTVGSVTFNVTADGVIDPQEPDVAISAHDFDIGVNLLTSAGSESGIQALARVLGGAHAWKPSDGTEIAASTVAVDLGGLTMSAKSGQTFNVTFTVSDENGSASYTVKATVTPHVIYSEALDIALSAYDFDILDDAITDANILTLAKPKAWIPSTGKQLPAAAIVVTDKNQLVGQTEGTHPVTLTATNPDKQESTVNATVDATVSLAPAEFEFELDAHEVVLTGAWNDDSTHTFTVKLKKNGQAASEADFHRVTITPALTGGFEEIEGAMLDSFISSTTLSNFGTEDGWGTAQFTVTTKKSGIVKYVLKFDGKGEEDVSAANVAVVITPGDANRDEKLTATDSYVLGQTVLGESHAYENEPWNMQLCDLNGDGRITSADSSMLAMMILGTLPSN